MHGNYSATRDEMTETLSMTLFDQLCTVSPGYVTFTPYLANRQDESSITW